MKISFGMLLWLLRFCLRRAESVSWVEQKCGTAKGPKAGQAEQKEIFAAERERTYVAIV